MWEEQKTKERDLQLKKVQGDQVGCDWIERGEIQEKSGFIEEEWAMLCYAGRHQSYCIKLVRLNLLLINANSTDQPALHLFTTGFNSNFLSYIILVLVSHDSYVLNLNFI